MTLAVFSSLLAAHNCKPTGNGNQIAAKCPGHDDSRASLSVSNSADGKLLLKCHAGCNTEAICAALGIKLADLFADKLQRNGAGKQIVAEYSYHDENRMLLYESVRYSPKTFKQRRPDGLGGWIWNMDGVRRILFRLPETLAAIKAGLPIFLTEGEKDALAMVEHGFCATTNAGGAGKWQLSYSETLRGAVVIIIADKDPAGRKHAADVAQKLLGIAASVKTIELPDTNGKPVKDAADYFTAGGEAADLDAIAEAAPEFDPSKTDIAPDDNPAEVKPLPAIIDVESFLREKIEAPKELVAGILHQGSKLVFGGGSKTFKTWILIDLALAISAGEPWLSSKTKKGRVLFLNFEIQPSFFQQRIRAVADAKQIALVHGMIDLWNLRGQAASYASIFPRIIERVKDSAYALIVLDPIYKCYGDVDENSAGAVAGLMNAIEALAVETGAAIAFGAHYSKGNQAGKESIDRISGSGVFARDPDSILNFTRHEEADAFSLELTLRNFPPVAPFVVRWIYPLMRRDDELDPAKLKQVNKGGSSKSYTVGMIVECLGKHSLNTAAFQKRCKDEAGITPATFYRLFKEAKEAGIIIKQADETWQLSELSKPPIDSIDTITISPPIGADSDSKGKSKHPKVDSDSDSDTHDRSTTTGGTNCKVAKSPTEESEALI